jgi:lysophospholipase L1-like esterase
MRMATLARVLAIACLIGGSLRGETFHDGETVVFLGDSITHGGPFHGMISAYYLTRFPDRTVRFVNAGIAGDTAGGAMGRLDEDVLSKSPSTVVIMMGMNDVGRGNYVAEPTTKQREAQTRSLNGHQANMDRLLGRIQTETDARFMLMTPTPFDQTCVNDRDNNQPGCNDALGKCAEMARELAPKYEAKVVDLHGPMTAFNVQRQENDPGYTLIGPDRVHPGPPGHLMMAWLFLKSQEAPSLVSAVTFDAATGRVTKAANASVSEIQRRGDGWSFTVLEKALPFPVDEKAREILDAIPLEMTLNQEIVQITGLASGSHTLLIDGTRVACHSATEWANGVNLAFNPAAPQVKQAEKVAELNEARRQTEVTLRGYACVRWFLRHRRIDPDDLAAVRTYAETKMNKNGYYEGKVPTYLKEWERHHEVVAQVAAQEKEALLARIPVPHEYGIRPDH